VGAKDQGPTHWRVIAHAAEAKLEKGFRDQSAAYLANGGADLRYLAFDFHKECGAKNYHRLSVLWDQVSA
jgi:hypothetical protein